MGILTWITSQTTIVKILLGIFFGLIVWGILRYFIHLANKGWAEGQHKKANWKESLTNLAKD